MECLTCRSRQAGKTLVIWLTLIVAVFIAALAARFSLTPTAPPPAMQAATLLPTPRPLTDFHLIDHTGSPFDAGRLKGRWSLLFFGYTNCPDVCPTTLSELNRTVRLIAADSPQAPAPQVVFVSIDPARDTVDRLRAFVPYFNKGFVGVTGEQEAVAAFAKQLNAFYMKAGDSPSGDGYLVDHTASVSLIDPEGRLHAIFSPPLAPNAIAADYTALTNYYEALR